MTSIPFILTFLNLTSLKAETTLCHYETWDWDTKQNRSVNHREVLKSYSELTTEERGSISGCSLCKEDQEIIELDGIPSFKICKIYKTQVKKILEDAKDAGFFFEKIISYRVGKSVGKKDSFGLRTKFSQHSYGLALDINPTRNGMYQNCINFNKDCKLIHGGKYYPNEKGAITSSTRLTKDLKNLGFKWGGEFEGRQKDFMHFSLE